MRKNIEKYYPKYAKLSDVGSHFGAICLKCSSGGTFVLRPGFRNLWGVLCPLGPMFTSLEHHWHDFLDFWEDLRIKFAPSVKGSRAAFRCFANTWHQPHVTKNKQGLKKTNIHYQSGYIRLLLLLLNKAAEIRDPSSLTQTRTAELPKG